MLGVLGSDSITEPGRGADLILRQLYREAMGLPYLWRAKYNLPPTDPRFLEMDEDEMARDLLLAVYHQYRTRRDDPDDPLMQQLRRNSPDARRAILRLRAEEARLRRQVETVTRPPRAPRAITKVTVISTTTDRDPADG